MEWIIALNGDEIDLRELAKVCNIPELTIEKEVHSYILKSTHFSSLFSNQEVREKANEILDLLNGAMKFELSARRPIEIAHVKKIDCDGTTLTYVVAYDVVPIRVLESEKIDREGKEEIRNAADPVITFFKLAQSDPKFAKICQYINQNFNSWSTLYKIYEVIKGDKFKPLEKGEKYYKKAELFRRTANNPSSSGLNSRHANDEAPPENPMSLSDAKSFIKMLIIEWIEIKKGSL